MASTTTSSTSPPLLLVKRSRSVETREASSRSEPRVASPMTLGDDSDNEADSAAAVSIISNLSDLTPDLWAKVLGYARYEDCLRAFTICKGFLRDVIPRVKEIAVFDGRALLVRPARHFTGVKSVVIACLFADPAGAPPPPERPAGSGYDISTAEDMSAMTGNDFYAHELHGKVERPLEVDLAVVSAAVPFLSAFSSLERVDLLRYVLATFSGKPHAIAMRYYSGDHFETWSKENDVKMKSLMMSFCGGYASGLLSSNVIVESESLYGWSATNRQWECYWCFSSHCVSWDGWQTQGEPRQCMCSCICTVFPLKMITSIFYMEECGCLPLVEGMKCVLRREGGRECLLSPEYILGQVNELLGADLDCKEFGFFYAKAGLPRPVITDLDIARYHPERPDPWATQFSDQVESEAIHMRERRLTRNGVASFLGGYDDHQQRES